MIVAHLDLDAFFAAVEELEEPELRSKPLVVGGDPRGRGVVATANYVAREYGIRSAMSCAEALRRCPQAVFVRPRHSLYAAYSRDVWAAIREVCPTVERTGLDEGTWTSARSPAISSVLARSRRPSRRPSGRRRPPVGLARRRLVQGGREGRERPPEARWAARRAARA